MLRCVETPANGTFIEVRLHSICIVGRVIWSHGDRCGIRTQDKVHLALPPGRDIARSEAPDQERRTAPRRQALSIAERADASRRISRTLDWVAITFSGAVLAFLAAEAVHSILDASLAPVRTQLVRAGEVAG
jgi:hypothetical protein